MMFFNKLSVRLPKKNISFKFGHLMASLALVTNLAQMAPLVIVANLATRWCHLHCLQIWPPDGTTCIDSKVGHQVTSHTLPHCHGLPYWHYQLVLSLYLHQLESHQLSLHKGIVSQLETNRPVDRTRDTWV